MKYTKKIVIMAAALIAAALFFYMQNNMLTVEKYTIQLPQNTIEKTENKSVKIVHLSDLHNKGFGKDQKNLMEKITELHPDIILFTGDLIDSRRKGTENAFTLMKSLSEKYPVYRILGNHDFSKNGYEISNQLEDTSVITLRNESLDINLNDINITLKGVDDPISYKRSVRQDLYTKAVGKADTDNYSILLAHRPEYFSLYEKSGYDIALSGHAHGGQIRLPVIGGFFAPHQGAFPKYDGGRYFPGEDNGISRKAAVSIVSDDLAPSEGGFSMILSRGLGNSLFPFRIFNLPEIIFIELTK